MLSKIKCSLLLFLFVLVQKGHAYDGRSIKSVCLVTDHDSHSRCTGVVLGPRTILVSSNCAKGDKVEIDCSDGQRYLKESSRRLGASTYDSDGDFLSVIKTNSVIEGPVTRVISRNHVEDLALASEPKNCVHSGFNEDGLPRYSKVNSHWLSSTEVAAFYARKLVSEFNRNFNMNYTNWLFPEAHSLFSKSGVYKKLESEFRSELTFINDNTFSFFDSVSLLSDILNSWWVNPTPLTEKREALQKAMSSLNLRESVDQYLDILLFRISKKLKDHALPLGKLPISFVTKVEGSLNPEKLGYERPNGPLFCRVRNRESFEWVLAGMQEFFQGWALGGRESFIPTGIHSLLLAYDQQSFRMESGPVASVGDIGIASELEKLVQEGIASIDFHNGEGVLENKSDAIDYNFETHQAAQDETAVPVFKDFNY